MAIKHFCAMALLLVLSGCTCLYSYRKNESEAWTATTHYWVHAGIRGDAHLAVGIRPQGYFEGDVVDTSGGVTYIDSSMVLEPYFHRRGELVEIGKAGVFDDRYYSLDGIDGWRGSLPLHVYLRYQVDSNGVVVMREEHVELQKHSNCFFSVH